MSEPRAAVDGRTLDWGFTWLLKGAVVASLVFAFANSLFFALIANESEGAVGVVLVVPWATALFNCALWRLWRDAPWTPAKGVVFVVGNATLLIGRAALALSLWGAVGPYLGIFVPAFLVLAVVAGVVGGPRGAVPLLGFLGLGLMALRLLLERNEAPAEELFALSPAVVATLFAAGLPAAWLAQRIEKREVDLQKANEQLADAQVTLSRYVAPQIAAKILEGNVKDVWDHKRRKLTLFFSDIKDFTATTDSMEPEDLARVLNEYLDEMVTIAAAHNGTIAQISGDGLFIFFGAPEFVSDQRHALDATRMAVAMQQRMIELRKRWFSSGIELPFRIRCGINTGMATVGGFGSDGRREYTAIGMQTNLAARLEAACVPGEILLSHATWGLVKDEVPCIEGPPLEAKGYHRPIQTYRIQIDAPQPTTTTTT